MTQNYNKGEWSESYVLLKLLADGKLYAADSDLNKIYDIFYPLISILRFESNNQYNYEYDKSFYDVSSKVNIIDSKSGVIMSIPIQEFKEKSTQLFNEIKTGEGRSFPVSKEMEEFLNSIQIRKKTEKPTKKRDITIIVHDEQIGHNTELGFSIKSKLGSPATLINAAGTTNFIYELKGGKPLTEEEIKEINLDKEEMKKTMQKNNLSENSIKNKEKCGFDKFDELKNSGTIIDIMKNYGYEINFVGTENKTFKSNLQMFDSNFPYVFSEILLAMYTNQCGNSLEEVLEYIKHENPCKYDLSTNHPIYRYKMKNFLTDASLGMMPGQVWEGTYDATGGYIIVKKDGEIVCYHIYNRKEFQEYLIKNTYLEINSRFKHGYGYVYRENDKLYIKLNLAVRFN